MTKSRDLKGRDLMGDGSEAMALSAMLLPRPLRGGGDQVEAAETCLSELLYAADQIQPRRALQGIPAVYGSNAATESGLRAHGRGISVETCIGEGRVDVPE